MNYLFQNKTFFVSAGQCALSVDYVADRHVIRTDQEVERDMPQIVDVAASRSDATTSRPQGFGAHRLSGPAKLADRGQGARCGSEIRPATARFTPDPAGHSYLAADVHRTSLTALRRCQSASCLPSSEGGRGFAGSAGETLVVVVTTGGHRALAPPPKGHTFASAQALRCA